MPANYISIKPPPFFFKKAEIIKAKFKNEGSGFVNHCFSETQPPPSTATFPQLPLTHQGSSRSL